jgi:hypothetical protein
MPEQEVGLPEWGDAEEVERLFSITRGTLYKLADAGRIDSALIKTRENARKGIRLFNIESIRRLLAASTI